MSNRRNFVENARGQPVESKYSELTLGNRERTLKGINPITVGQVLNAGDPVALELVKLGRLIDSRQPPPSTSTPPAISAKEERPTGGGSQGVAAKPRPVQKTLVANGVNTNTNQELQTKNSEFSTGERTTGSSFNIGRFRSQVSGADSILPTHSFLVVFAPMPWATKKFPAGNLDSLLTMRCDNVVLPAINLLQEQNIRRYGFGPVENVAYGVNVGDFTLQFIVDKDALVVEFFEEWLNLIVNRDSFGGANINNNKIGGMRRPYEIAYKDTYACPNVNVFVYDRSQNAVMEYHIYDVFPTGIQSINMSWSEENTLMKLNITFSFTDLRIERSKSKNKKSQSINDQIKVTATGRTYAIQGGVDLATLDPTGARGLELTDLSNETTIIGTGGFRTRGSVTPVQLSTPSTSSTADVPIPKDYTTLGVEINIAPNT